MSHVSNTPEGSPQPIFTPSTNESTESEQEYTLPKNAPHHLLPQDKEIFKQLMQIATQAGNSAEQTKRNKVMKEKLEEAVKDDTTGVGPLSPELSYQISLVANNIPA